MSESAAWAGRVIIALDLDAFYVAASRKRDPSLIGLPVGIKQKNILATVSYEARALGVRKLATVRDGMAQCPEMILVNGEDLSYFRKISMQVFKLVSSMVVGGRVEKLGMDELFCDCTEMVEAQLAELDTTQELAPMGNVLPSGTERYLRTQNAPLDSQVRKLFLATHLAHKIRSRVAEEVGLTSSAGIATSKLMAKLVGNVHKPNQQTVFVSLNPDAALADNRAFLDPYSLRSLNGFGSVIVDKMCTVAARSTGMKERDFPSSQLTVSLARQIFGWQSLKDIFGERLGSRLYKLLNGQDDEPVNKAPEYPAQISIEDTYRNLQGDAILGQIFVLSQSLLRRLETELVEVEDSEESDSAFSCIVKPAILGEEEVKNIKVRDYEEEPLGERGPEAVRSDWKRYPLSVRLSIRQGWSPRVSRQGRMPVEIFDLSVSREERARVLAQRLASTYRAIIASEGDKGEGLNLINIAALDLDSHRPSRAIGGFFSNEKRETLPSKAANTTSDMSNTEASMIDLNFLNELPPDLRREVAKEYGLELPEEQDQEGDWIVCEACGNLQNSWLQHDHTKWPLNGLPNGKTGNESDSVQWLEADEDELDDDNAYL